jgi:hypothetical protein
MRKANRNKEEGHMLELLADLGFEKGESFYIDTWVYQGMFWVEVSEPEIWVWYTFEGDEHGVRHPIDGRAGFFKAFIDAVTRRAIDSVHSYQPD